MQMHRCCCRSPIGSTSPCPAPLVLVIEGAHAELLAHDGLYCRAGVTATPRDVIQDDAVATRRVASRACTSGCAKCTQPCIAPTIGCSVRSVPAGDPVEDFRGGHRPLRRIRIQGAGNRGPALPDNFRGKLLRVGFRLEFSGRADESTLAVFPPGSYVRAIGNVPNLGVSQAICLEDFPRTTSRGNHRLESSFRYGDQFTNCAMTLIELRQEQSQKSIQGSANQAAGFGATSPWHRQAGSIKVP